VVEYLLLFRKLFEESGVMAMHFDHKGKYFTDVVSKEIVSTTIQTLTVRIKGCLHVRSGLRFKDEINKAEQFIAVTDAVVYSTRGEELYRTDFLAVNTDHIVWIGPEDGSCDESKQE
jgi:hypothetical protein